MKYIFEHITLIMDPFVVLHPSMDRERIYAT